MWCRLLCDRPTSPIIVILDYDHAIFAMPSQCLQYPPHTGKFSVPADRIEVNKFIRIALRNKIGQLEMRTAAVDTCRYFKARFEDILGLPPAKRNPSSFASHFGFGSREQAVDENTFSMSAVACAVLSKDVKMLGWLLRAGSSFQKRLDAMTDVGISPGWTPLHLAASCQDPAPLEQLLTMRANPNTTDAAGISVLAACSSGKAVEDAGAFSSRREPSSGSKLQNGLAGQLCPLQRDGAVAALIECRAHVHRAELCCLAMAGTMRPHAVQLAQLLLSGRAEVNASPQSSGRESPWSWPAEHGP